MVTVPEVFSSISSAGCHSGETAGENKALIYSGFSRWKQGATAPRFDLIWPRSKLIPYSAAKQTLPVKEKQLLI